MRFQNPIRLLDNPPPNRGLVRQDIILQPLSEPVLFAIHPVYASPQTPEDVRVNGRTEQLFSKSTQEDRPRVEYRYAVVTTGLVGGIQLDVTPTGRPRHESDGLPGWRLIRLWWRLTRLGSPP